LKLIKTIFLLILSQSLEESFSQEFTTDENNQSCYYGLLFESKLDTLSDDIKKTKCQILKESNQCRDKTLILDEKKVALAKRAIGVIDKTIKEKGTEFEVSTRKQLYLELLGDRAESVDKVEQGDYYRASRLMLSKRNNNQSDYSKVKDNYQPQDQSRNKSLGSKVKITSPYHNVIGRAGKKGSFSDYVDGFAEDYAKFSQMKKCQKGVQVGYSTNHQTHHYDENIKKLVGNNKNQCVSNKNELYKYLNNNKESIKESLKNKYGSTYFEKTGFACSGKPQIVTYTGTIPLTSSCAGSFTHLFKDNVWTIAREATRSDPKLKELNNCVQKMKAKGLKMTGVIINSSSSQLNNTGNASKKFCSKGFSELSQARGNAAKELITKGMGFKVEPSKVKINFRGRNGNGTSGACPYKVANGKEVLKPEFRQGGAKRKVLDSSKYVKVTISFQPSAGPIKKIQKCHKIKYNCSSLKYKCREWEHWDPIFRGDFMNRFKESK
jgi:hypothetical protein